MAEGRRVRAVFADSFFRRGEQLFAKLGSPVAGWKVTETRETVDGVLQIETTWKKGDRRLYLLQAIERGMGFESSERTCSAEIRGLPYGGFLKLHSSQDCEALDTAAGPAVVVDAWSAIVAAPPQES